MNIKIEQNYDISSGMSYCHIFLNTGRVISKFSEALNREIEFEESFNFAFELPDALTLFKPTESILSTIIDNIEIGINAMLVKCKKDKE